MPRGIYPRKRQASQSVAAPAPAAVTDTTQPQRGPFGPSFHGLPPLEAVPQTFNDGSTTDSLFGVQEGGPEEVEKKPEVVPEPEPQAEPEQQPAPEQKPAEESVPEPAQPEPQAADDIESWFEKNRDKKKKLKYGDGEVEEEMTIADMVKNVQTWKHLGHISNKIGEQRRALAQEREQLEAMRRQAPQQADQGFELPADPQDASARRIAALEAHIASLSNTLAPTVYQTARQRVDQELKSEGFNDFMSYIPKMEVAIATMPNPQLQAYYDTPEGAKDLYFRLKAKEMAEAKATAPAAPPQASKAPPKQPPIIKVDSGTPSGSGVSDDRAAKYKAAFARFQANPKDPRAFSELMALKGYNGG